MPTRRTTQQRSSTVPEKAKRQKDIPVLLESGNIQGAGFTDPRDLRQYAQAMDAHGHGRAERVLSLVADSWGAALGDAGPCCR